MRRIVVSPESLFRENCWLGHIEKIKKALDNPAFDPNQTDARQWTALTGACYNRKLEVVLLLLTHKNIRLNHQDSDGYTPLHIACLNNDLKIVGALLSHPSIDYGVLDKQNRSALFIACSYGFEEVAKILLERRRGLIDLYGFDYYYPLFKEAYLQEHMDIQNLIYSYMDESAFIDACDDGYVEVVKFFLLKKDVDINKNFESNTPFFLACSGNHIEIVKLLLSDSRTDLNASRNEQRNTPFLIACLKNHVEVVKVLLKDNRIDVNKKDKDGVTPFLGACNKGHVEIVHLLLNNKRVARVVNINPRDKHNRTPFSIACEKKHFDIVSLLTIENLARNPSDKQESPEELAKMLGCKKEPAREVLDEIRKAQLDSSSIKNRREELGQPPAGEIFAMIVYFSDGYLKVKEIVPRESASPQNNDATRGPRNSFQA